MFRVPGCEDDQQHRPYDADYHGDGQPDPDQRRTVPQNLVIDCIDV